MLDRSTMRVLWLFCSLAVSLVSCGADETASLSRRSIDDEAILAESLEALWKLRPLGADADRTYYVSFSERPGIRNPSPQTLERLGRALSVNVRPASEASITLDKGVVDRRTGKRGILLYAYVDAVRPERHVFVIAGLFDAGKSGQQWLLMFSRLNESTWSLRQACVLGVS